MIQVISSSQAGAQGLGMQVWRDALGLWIFLFLLCGTMCVSPAGWDRKLGNPRFCILEAFGSWVPSTEASGWPPLETTYSPSRAPHPLQTDASFLTPGPLSRCTMTLQYSAWRESRPLSLDGVGDFSVSRLPRVGPGQLEKPQALSVWKALSHSSPTSGLRFLPKKIKGLFLFQSPCLTKTLQKSLGWIGFYSRIFFFLIISTLSSHAISPFHDPFLFLAPSRSPSFSPHPLILRDPFLTFLHFPNPLNPALCSPCSSLSLFPLAPSYIECSPPLLRPFPGPIHTFGSAISDGDQELCPFSTQRTVGALGNRNCTETCECLDSWSLGDRKGKCRYMGGGGVFSYTTNKNTFQWLYYYAYGW